MSSFSENLRRLRAVLSLKQSDIAEYLEVSMQSYSAYENGREPNYDILCKLASYFDVTTDYLLGLSKFKNANEQLVHDALKGNLQQGDNTIDILSSVSADIYTMLYEVQNKVEQNSLDYKEMLSSISAAFSLLSMYRDNLKNAERNSSYLYNDTDEMKTLLKTLACVRDSSLTNSDLRKLIVKQPQLDAFFSHLREFIYLYTLQSFDFEKADL